MQVQYVFTEKVLNPQIVCEQLHLCNQPFSNGKQRKELHTFLSHTESTLSQEQFSTDHVANGITRTRTSSKLHGDVDMNTTSPELPEAHQKSWKQHSGQITFVQISDIHLDRDYAEVHLKVLISMRNTIESYNDLP